jgi:hypothetical protein
MSIVLAVLLLIMALSSATIVWLVAREVAKRLGYPTLAGGARRTALEAK